MNTLNGSSNIAFTFPITQRLMFADFHAAAWLHIGLEYGNGLYVLSLPFDNEERASERESMIDSAREFADKDVWIEHDAGGGARIEIKRIVFTATE